MGYMCHHTLIVSGSGAHLEEARDQAIALVRAGSAGVHPTIHVTEISPPAVNGYQVFFVCPDGSKEGWPESDAGNRIRQEMIEAFAQIGQDQWGIAWWEVKFGDDVGDDRIVRSFDDDSTLGPPRRSVGISGGRRSRGRSSSTW